MSDEIRGFQDLDCWQRCRELRVFVAKEVVPSLPQSERFRLSDQLLRAARSTTANVAEGFGRYHFLDNAKFCGHARGSCHEILDHLITAHDEGLISSDLMDRAKLIADTAIKVLNGYIRYLQARAKSAEH